MPKKDLYVKTGNSNRSSSPSVSSSTSTDQFDDIPIEREQASTVSPMYRFSGFALKFDELLRRFFYQVGHKASDHEKSIIVLCLIVCLGLTAGIMFQVTESDAQKIWIPQDSVAQTHRRFIEDNFPKPPNVGTILLIPKDNGNIFTTDRLQKALKLQNEMTNVKDSNVQFLDLDVCVNRPSFANPTQKECLVNSIFYPWGNNETAFNALSIVTIQKTLRQLETQGIIPTSLQDVLFANIKRNSDSEITEASAMKMLWFTQGNNTKSKDWETLFLQKAATLNDTAYHSDFYIYFASDRSIQDELSRSVNNNLVYFAYAFILIVFYCAATLGERHRVYSKIALSLCAISAVVISIGASMGLAAYLGIVNTPVTAVIPFLILGIGVDDAFIIVDSFERVPKGSRTIPQRIGLGLSNAGASITMTSLTDIAAFLCGTITVLPAIQSFCLHAAFAVLIDFILQVTFFVSCMSLDVKRRAAKRLDCLCCIVDERPLVFDEESLSSVDSTGSQSTSQRMTSASKLAKSGSAHVALETMQSSPRTPKSRVAQLSSNGSNSPARGRSSSVTRIVRAKDMTLAEEIVMLAEKPKSKGLVSKFMGEYYAPFILHPTTRLFIFVLFAGVAVVGILGAVQLQQDFEVRQLAPDGSYLVNFLDAEDREWPSREIPFTIYTKEYDYHLAEKVTALEDVFSKMRDNKFVQSVPTNNWLQSYKTYVGASLASTDLNSAGVPVNKTLFYAKLSEFLAGSGARFAPDFEFNKGKTQILAARQSATLVPLKNSSIQVEAMSSVRSVAPDAKVDWFPFTTQFIFFEQFAVIGQEAYQNLMLAGLCVFVACTIFLVHPGTAFIVVMMVVMVDAGLLGFMFYFGLSIDSLTVANLVMALGLSVDYSAHVAHAFMAIPGTDNVERARLAMESMGASVFYGAMSTFLGICVLSFAPAELYRVFFKMFFGTIILGASCGLILLPVCLATFGPAPLPHVVVEHNKALEELDRPASKV